MLPTLGQAFTVKPCYYVVKQPVSKRIVGCLITQCKPDEQVCVCPRYGGRSRAPHALTCQLQHQVMTFAW